MKSFYIAAPWDMKAEAKRIAKWFVADGWNNTARWLELGDDLDSTHYKAEAVNDVVDVANSDVLILLNSQKRGEETSGKAVEMGMAIAWGLPVIVIGEWSNVFHFLPGVKMVKTIEEAVAVANEAYKELMSVVPLEFAQPRLPFEAGNAKVN